MIIKKKSRPLRRYQRNAFKFASQRAHTGLFIRMRFGKTILILRLSKFFNCSKVLIVGPYSVAQSWEDELTKEKESPLVYITGSRESRIEILNNFDNPNYHWFFSNKECHLSTPEIKDFPWDFLALDERFITYPDTLVTKFFVNNFRSVPHRFILCGNPAPESPLEYFTQLQFLNPECLQGLNYYQFRYRYFQEVSPNKFLLNNRGSKFLSKILSENCFFFTKKDAKKAGLHKEIIFEKRVIETNSKFQDMYLKLLKYFVLENSEGAILDKTKWSLTQYIWLRRLTSGFVHDDFLFDFKLNELLSLLKGELKDEKVVVWVYFINEIKMLQSQLLKNNIKCHTIYGLVKPEDRRKIQSDFSKDDTNTLLIQADCGKTGIDLSVASTAISYSLPVSLDTWSQSQERIVSLQKNDSLLHIVLLIKDSIDEIIYKSLYRKENSSTILINIAAKIQSDINLFKLNP